jgi:hypothetical protein
MVCRVRVVVRFDHVWSNMFATVLASFKYNEDILPYAYSLY